MASDQQKSPTSTSGLCHDPTTLPASVNNGVHQQPPLSEPFKPGDHVWFDSGGDFVTCLPGIVTDYSATNQLVTIESTAIENTVKVYNVQNSNVFLRQDLIEGEYDENGIDDMIHLRDIHELALFWNLKKRYERNKIYTFIGNILVSMNPYKMFEIYGLNMVKKYQNQPRSAQPPHLFAIGNLAYNKMIKDNENQSILIMGESGSGKTENTKLLLQYFAAINKSPSNIITEQILESIPLLESFGNSKTTCNNNASRYCKYIEIFFQSGIIFGAKTLEFLHEKSRIVSHNAEERNFHIFYELLEGLSDGEKEKYGLQSADKYFYLNQGNCFAIDGKDDAEDFRFLISAMQVLGFTNEEQDIIFRILASILHLGNVYFHRKQYRHGQEGVEIGSDVEIRWVSHLLQIPIEDLYKLLTVRTTETRSERVFTPLNIDQALDMRDAISKVLYVSLFTWLVQRINHIVYKPSAATRRQLQKIAILDMFGFENLRENNFEQLCINYANELMYSHYIKCVFRNEQAEYAKEKVEWHNVAFPDNQPILNLISKKPIGILPLLEDESNFPKANDNSFLEKCHYNHALNELYSRARLTAAEFGIKHFEGQVWYSVEGFLEKNRDILKSDVTDTLFSSKMPIMCKIFYFARECTDSSRPPARTADERFITIKPRTPTVSARFQESLNALLETASTTNPWFIRCIRPNNDRASMRFDNHVVHTQLQHSALLETIKVCQNGYPIRMKYAQFVARYHSFITSQLPRGSPSKEISKLIVEKKFASLPPDTDEFKFGFSKIFLKESAEAALEKDRQANIVKAAVKIQAHIRGYLTRRQYRRVRRNIIRIQTTYRAYRERKNYQTLRRGIVRLQATYRMQRQRQEYDKIKTLKHKRETDRYHQMEKAKAEAVQTATASAASKAVKQNGTSLDRISNHSLGSAIDRLEIPAELGSLMAKMDNWKCVHAFNDIVKIIKPVISFRLQQQLPYDIDRHSFAKFTNIYFRSHVWAMKREPIKAPFLQKNSDADFQESLIIFRMILRFMFDHELTGKKEKLLADYIVQKGLSNVALRDEIFCQLCNQTWKNEDLDSVDRGWILLVHCLNSFAPSHLLYKYLLKYVSDHAPHVYRPVLQRLLLTGDKTEPHNARAYPASLLEWKASLKKCGMSVDLHYANGDAPKMVQIDSWTTSAQLTAETLAATGFAGSHFGWTVDFEDDGDIYSLNGDNYVLDMVSQMELNPSFPASKNYFIGAKNPYRSARNLPNPFHNPEAHNRFELDGIVNSRLENAPKRESHVFLKSKVQKQLNNQKLPRSLSGETLMRVEESNNGSPPLGLAVNSKLNERYLKKHSSMQAFTQLTEADEEHEKSDHRTEGSNQSGLKLSEKSRLNQRYISNKATDLSALKKLPTNEARSNRKHLYTRKSDKHANNNKLLNQRSMSMQELGLASSSLNVRYFSRDKLNKTASLTGGSDNDSDSLNKVQSLMNFEENSSLASEMEASASGNKQYYPKNSGGGHHSHRNLPAESNGNSGTDYRMQGAILSAHTRSKQMMNRPPSHSSTTSSSFESDSSSCLNDTESPIDSEAMNKENGNAGGPVRYKKYNSSNKQVLSKSQQYLSRGFGPKDLEYMHVKSSAMSDTSEAPSLASHVRNIRIPSHTSELDQYLDDLFSPVLDANLDDAMSDARSLAQSIKGSSVDEMEEAQLESILTSLDKNVVNEMTALCDCRQLSTALKGGVNEIEPNSASRLNLSQLDKNNQGAIDSNLSNSNLQLNLAGLGSLAGQLDPNLLQQQVLQQQMYQMQQRAFLASSLQQNIEIQKQLLQQNEQLQLLLAQAVSPPTPINGNTEIPVAANRSSSASSIIYPLPPMSPIFQQTVNKTPTSTATIVDSSSSSTSNNSSLIDLKNKAGPSSGLKVSIVSSSGVNKAIPPPPPPPPPPPLSPGTDVFGRAKTVRIGKWRWPPPSEEASATTNANFIEFKRKKHIEKQQDKQHNGSSESSDSSSTGQGGATHRSIDSTNGENESKELTPCVTNGTTSSGDGIEQPQKLNVHDPSQRNKYIENTIPPGSIGKLRISSEMRAKLEQLTIDQSVRSSRRDRKESGGVIQSQSMDDLANMSSVKKLSEQRKALLERQLMGSLRNSNAFMETASTPNIKQSVDTVVSDHHNHSHHHNHKKLSQENSINSNYEPSPHLKRFIKNQHQNLLRKSGSREFRERREELGPYNRLSSSNMQLNQSTYQDRPLYTPDRYFHSKEELMQYNGGLGGQFDLDNHSGAESSQAGDRHSSSSGRFYGGSTGNGFGANKAITKRMNMPPPPPPEHGSPSGKDGAHYRNTQTTNDRISYERLEFNNESNVNSKELMLNGIDVDEKQMKTKLYHKNELNFYAYCKPKFRLNLRKEVFSPSETIDNPILVDMIFWQIVADVYSGNCIRLNEEETNHLQKQLKSEGVHSYNPALYQPKSGFKRSIIETAREMATYFSRLYVVSGGKTLANVDYLGVSHSNVILIKRDKTTEHDSLVVIDKFSFDEISEILIPSSCTLQILFHGGEWITLYSNKALQVRTLIEKFIVEHQQTNVEYVRTLKDFTSNEPSVLSFKKDAIIRVVKNKHLHLAKGWSFGVLEFGESGLFQTAHVVPLTSQQIQVYQRQMDENSLRNHTNQGQPHQPTMTYGHLNGGHHQSKELHSVDTPSLENSHPEFNSLWIDSRAETVTDEGKHHSHNLDNHLQMNGTGTANSMSQYGEGTFSLLQFALFNFRESLTKYDLRGHLKDNSIRGSIKMIENLKSKRKGKGKSDSNDWTWSEFANLVKYSKAPIQASLLMLPSELSKVATECFSAIMRYMGDLAMLKNQYEVDCVYTILVNCHKYPQIRDEIYCQLMKQTTSNKSVKPDSCQRGWRLFSIVAAYFDCSDTLQPYLFKYLETAAFDKRRAFHVTASITLSNLKKTFKYGGRKNVPSIEEIAAISAGRTSKRQIYRLPGGTERVLNTSCTTVVNDIIEEICKMLAVTNALEMEEFSLYCIIEGDPFTMPLNRDEYILDVTTELLKNGQTFYLIFCRSVWYYPLRLDSHLYIEVIFNQVAPDYLEGLLIIIPNDKLPDDIVQQIARIASLLHRAAELEQMPTKEEIKFLLPKPVVAMRTVKPHQWVEMVQNHWNDMSALSPIEAKAQCLDILQKWSLFGSCFFAVKRIQNDSHTHPDHILALNKDGVHFLDMVTHDKVWKHPFSEVISTRKVRSEDGTLYLDMKCGNLMVQKITRIQTDQAHEISRLIRQYIDIEQHFKSGRNSASDSNNGGGSIHNNNSINGGNQHQNGKLMVVEAASEQQQ